MIEPLDVFMIGFAGALLTFVAVWLIILYVAIGEFRDRLKDDATLRGTIEVFPKYMRYKLVDEIDWWEFARRVPALMVAGAIVFMALVVFAVGFVEVFL